MKTREFVALDFVAHPEFGLPRGEWLAHRRKGVGSSDAAAILGLDRFNSPLSVWLDKTGQAEEKEETASMRWGNRLEDAVAAEYAAEHAPLVPFRPTAMYQHHDVDIALCDPDRLIIDPVNGRTLADDGALRILEIKTGRVADIWEDGPPPSYVIQVMHQLAVTGLDRGDIAVLLNGHDYRSFVIERDDVLCDSLMEQELAFWKLVETTTPPDVDGHEATTEALRRMYRSASRDKAVVLPETTRDVIARYHETNDRLKVVKENHEQAANELRALLGDAEIGVIDGETVVTWRAPTKGKGRVDMDALEAQHPEIVATFRKPVTDRRIYVAK